MAKIIWRSLTYAHIWFGVGIRFLKLKRWKDEIIFISAFYIWGIQNTHTVWPVCSSTHVWNTNCACIPQLLSRISKTDLRWDTRQRRIVCCWCNNTFDCINVLLLLYVIENTMWRYAFNNVGGCGCTIWLHFSYLECSQSLIYIKCIYRVSNKSDCNTKTLWSGLVSPRLLMSWCHGKNQVKVFNASEAIEAFAFRWVLITFQLDLQ